LNKTTENSGTRRDAARRPVVVVVIVVAVAVVAAALLLKGRKPAQPPGQAPTGEAQPVAEVVPKAVTGRKAASTTNAAESATGDTLPFKEERRIMANASLPLSERSKAAEALAQKGTDAALAALKAAFASGPEELRVAIAQSLGKCASPECAKWLEDLLQDPSVLVARGAVRGLAEQNTAEAASALIRMLSDANGNMDLRSEIASSLGSVDQPGVTEALAELARSAEDDDLTTAALNSLGGRDFGQTEGFFKQYLQTPGISSELRVSAVEALAQAQGDPTAFLLSMATDTDPDVRASAAWAMSATEATGNAGAQLLDLLSKETDPDVRLRLYQALRNQESFDTGAAMSLVERETDPSARVAGMDLLAQAVRDTPTPQLQSFFAQTAVPELKQIALGGQSYDDRQAAIIALTRARTPAALAALGELAQAQASPPPASRPR
jgi:HEAT repeat protein